MAALPSVTYTGVSGSIAFDAQGDAIRDTAYIKAADTASGAWVLETSRPAPAADFQLQSNCLAGGESPRNSRIFKTGNL